jgi:hypothetical protein
MQRKFVVATVLCLVLLTAVAIAAPAASAQATIINYTSTEVLQEFSMTTPVPFGSVEKFGMQNHFLDCYATHPWGNCDVYTNSSWVRHADGMSTFTGSYSTHSAEYGDTEGWFTGWMSWVTGEMYYRYNGKGVSGEVAGALWHGSSYSSSFFAVPLTMTARILVP